jgi:AraC family transcriptional regulator
MQPEIVEKESITLVGFSFFGDPFKLSGGWTEENEIGRLWNRFMTYLEHHPDRPRYSQPGVAYEVHIDHVESQKTGEFEVFVGVEVDSLEDVPVQMSVKFLPPATYAVFTLEGEQIVSDWLKLIEDWMAQTGHERLEAYSFQYYDERFRGLQRLQESTLDVYIPIKKS